MKCILPALLCAALLAGAGQYAPVFAGTFIDKFIGTWRGSGTARFSYDGDAQPVTCNTTAHAAGTNTVVVEGHCTTSSLSGNITLRMTETGDTTYRATVRVTGSIVTYRYRGQRSGNRIVFDAPAPVLADGAPFHSRFVVKFGSATSFSMNETATNLDTGRVYPLSNLRFSRQ